MSAVPLTQIRLDQGLTEAERLYLKALSLHEGFAALKKMFENACRSAHEDMVKLDPMDPQYEAHLKYLHQRERVINEFANGIRKSFEANVVEASAIEAKESKSFPMREN